LTLGTKTNFYFTKKKKLYEFESHVYLVLSLCVCVEMKYFD